MAAAAPTASRVDGYPQYGTPAHLGRRALPTSRGGESQGCRSGRVGPWKVCQSAGRSWGAIEKGPCPPTVRIDWEKVIGGLGPGCRAKACDQARFLDGRRRAVDGGKRMAHLKSEDDPLFQDFRQYAGPRVDVQLVPPEGTSCRREGQGGRGRPSLWLSRYAGCIVAGLPDRVRRGPAVKCPQCGTDQPDNGQVLQRVRSTAGYSVNRAGDRIARRPRCRRPGSQQRRRPPAGHRPLRGVDGKCPSVTATAQANWHPCLQGSVVPSPGVRAINPRCLESFSEFKSFCVSQPRPLQQGGVALSHGEQTTLELVVLLDGLRVYAAVLVMLA